MTGSAFCEVKNPPSTLSSPTEHHFLFLLANPFTTISSESKTLKTVPEEEFLVVLIKRGFTVIQNRRLLSNLLEEGSLLSGKVVESQFVSFAHGGAAVAVLPLRRQLVTLPHIHRLGYLASLTHLQH